MRRSRFPRQRSLERRLFDDHMRYPSVALLWLWRPESAVVQGLGRPPGTVFREAASRPQMGPGPRFATVHWNHRSRNATHWGAKWTCPGIARMGRFFRPKCPK
jgi:hypothetical protein